MTRRLILVAAALALVACNPIYVSHDYDRDADFASYRTYSWMPFDVSGPADARQAQQQSPLMHKRTVSLVDEQLVKDGLTKKVEGDVDLWVTYYGESEQQVQIRQRRGYDPLGTTVQHYEEGTLIIDLIDATTNKLVWRGIAEATLSDNPTAEEEAERLKDSIKKVFKKFPPK